MDLWNAAKGDEVLRWLIRFFVSRRKEFEQKERKASVCDGDDLSSCRVEKGVLKVLCA